MIYFLLGPWIEALKPSKYQKPNEIYPADYGSFSGSISPEKRKSEREMR